MTALWEVGGVGWGNVAEFRLWHGRCVTVVMIESEQHTERYDHRPMVDGRDTTAFRVT